MTRCLPARTGTLVVLAHPGSQWGAELTTKTRLGPGPCQDRGEGEGVNCGAEADERSRGRGGRVGEGVDAPTGLSLLSTYLVDYGYLTPWSAPCQPPWKSRLVNHDDHVRLIETAIDRNRGGVWADFGAGSGAFTLAIRDIAGPDAAIVAVDRDRASLRTLRATMERRFPGTRLSLLQADIADRLTLPRLDGILAANAIHYIPKSSQVALLQYMEGIPAAGRASDRGRVRQRNGKQLGAVSDVVRRLPGVGSHGGLYGARAARGNAIPVVGLDLCRACVPVTMSSAHRTSRRGS